MEILAPPLLGTPNPPKKLISLNLYLSSVARLYIRTWFMPINVLLTFIFGSALGWIVNKITRALPQLKGLIVACCSAGNLGNMLLIIIPSRCKEKASPFGAPNVCHTYRLAYASLSMALGAIFLWSYVYNIVRVTANITTVRPTVESPDLHTKLISESCKNYSVSVDYIDESELPVAVSEDWSSERKGIICTVRRILSSISSVINFKRLFAPSTIGVFQNRVPTNSSRTNPENQSEHDGSNDDIRSRTH